MLLEKVTVQEWRSGRLWQEQTANIADPDEELIKLDNEVVPDIATLDGCSNLLDTVKFFDYSTFVERDEGKLRAAIQRSTHQNACEQYGNADLELGKE